MRELVLLPKDSSQENGVLLIPVTQVRISPEPGREH